MRIIIVCVACLSLAAFAGPVHAGSVTYTEQGVTFDLEVTDSGSTVKAELKVTSDTTGDFLQTVGVKIFSSYIAPSSLIGPASHSWSVLPGTRQGADGGVSNPSSGANKGFVSADDSDAGDSGPEMDGSIYKFNFEWNTTVDPISEWSIRAWTAEDNDGTFDKNKSRQWSSGGLTPGNGGGEPVPEPGTLALMGAGLLGLAIARRRRRNS